MLWPDFRLPVDDNAAKAFRHAWLRAETEPVEVACWGGRGRTGTALACMAVLDGLPGAEAIGHVRDHYDPRAVETTEQETYVMRFADRGLRPTTLERPGRLTSRSPRS